MATKINYKINGIYVNPPFNWKELEIELNFDKNKSSSQAQVNITDWEWVRENSHIINQWIADGTGNGVGIFEAPTLEIEVERNGVVEKVFNGYLSLNKEHTLSCNRSTIKSVEKGRVDWLNDVADGVTFEYLASIGEISPSDYKFVPYVLNSVPNYKEAAIMTISVFMLIVQIQTIIEKISEMGAEGANPFEGTVVVRAVIYVAYLTILLAAIVKLIIDLIQLIIQPVKYHAGMNLLTLMQKASSHFGYNFKSPILETEPFNRAVIIPEKFRLPPGPSDERVLGFINPSPNEVTGFFKGSVGDLIRIVKTMFNAKIVINNLNELWIVRDDYNVSTPSYQMPDVYQPFYRYNSDEIKRNYLVSFEYDVTDKNTIQEYLGVSYQVTLSPIRVINKQLITLDGFHEARIPLALAKIKTELTVPEKIIKFFLDIFDFIINGIISAINSIIKIINKIIKIINTIIKALRFIGIRIKFQIKPLKNIQPVTISSVIENRIGMMKIENDNFTKPKILILNEGSEPKFNKIDENNSIILSAKYLYDNFHFINSFAPSKTRPMGNQVRINDNEKFPFCFEDFQKVQENNRMYDPHGKEVECSTLKWNVYNQHANNTVRLPYLYTNNLKEIPYEADGQ